MSTPIPNYRKRSGVTTLFKTIKYLCKIYGLYRTSIRNWITSAAVDPLTRNTILSWLDQVTAVCELIDGLPDD